MKGHNFTTRITVNQSPAEVFAAIQNVRRWWSSDIEGNADSAGDIFKHRYADVHRCEVVVKELVPGRKVVWTVLDNYFSFVDDQSEWKDTDIVFEIARTGDRTELTFTHVGLVPTCRCYGICADGWQGLIKGDLHDLIALGSGGNPSDTSQGEGP